MELGNGMEIAWKQFPGTGHHSLLLISVPFEHSVRAVNYSVVVFKSEAATTSCTDWHQSYNKKTSVQGTAIRTT